jgi:putative hydrolase of the HAD superfamily
MIALIQKLKAKYGVKTVVVSNESRELNEYRIHEFKLVSFIDVFISSCFVHLRKPDPSIFLQALDVAQVKPENVLYIENTPMFVEIAEELGIKSILHVDYLSTCLKLKVFDLSI